MSELSFEELFNEAVNATESTTEPVEQVEDQTSTEQVEQEVAAQADTEQVQGDGQESTDYRELYEKEKHRTSSWDGRLRAKDRENEELKAQLVTLQRQVESAVSSGSKQDVETTDESVKSFLTEFPELATPIRKMIEEAVSGTRAALESRVEREVLPLQTTVQETIRERHFNAINSAHSDFEEIVKTGELKSWIDKQPSFIRTAYDNVYNGGTATEVIDLLDQYKIMNRSSSSQQSVQSESEVNRHKPAAAVKSRGSGVPNIRKPIDKDDFDSAWQAAIS